MDIGEMQILLAANPEKTRADSTARVDKP